MSEELQWVDLVRMEPRLLDLEKEVIQAAPNVNCDGCYWERTLKAKLTKLVGWEVHRHTRGRPKELKSHTAYSLAVQHLLEHVRVELRANPKDGC